MRNSCVSMGANQNNQVQMLLQIKDEKFVRTTIKSFAAYYVSVEHDPGIIRQIKERPRDGIVSETRRLLFLYSVD